MPSLENLHQQYKDKPFAIIAVDVQEKKSTVQNFLKKYTASYTNLLDEDGMVSALYGVSSTPVKFIIDSDGMMVGAALGYREWDGSQMKSLIDLLIESSQNK